VLTATRHVNRNDLSKREIALPESEVFMVETDTHVCSFDLPCLRRVRAGSRFNSGASTAPNDLQVSWETRMSWKTPKIIEVPVGMEINMYACAARK